MTGRPDEPMTAEAFLAWAEVLPDTKGRELRGGVVARRAPPRMRDLLIRGALLHELLAAEEGDEAEHVVLGPGAAVVLDETTALDPDLVVAPRAKVDWDAVTAPDPVAIVEIVRRGDRATDWVARLRGYAVLPSLRHVLVLDAAGRRALHLRRTGPGPEGWDGRVLVRGVVRLDPVRAGVDLERLWAERSRVPGATLARG